MSRLHLVEEFEDLTLARIGSLVLMLSLFNDFVRQLAVAAHELISHVLELLLFSLKFLLYKLVTLLAFKNHFC